MEGSHFTRYDPGPLRILCIYCDRHFLRSRCLLQSDSLDSNPHTACAAVHWLCGSQVWRSGDGRAQVCRLIDEFQQLVELLCRSLGPLIITLIPGKHLYLEHLKRVRQELAMELGEAIDEFGPQIWEDFDKVMAWRDTKRFGTLISLFRIAFLSPLQAYLPHLVNLGYGGERVEWVPWMHKAIYSLIPWYVHLKPM